MSNANPDVYRDNILETQAPNFTSEHVKGIARTLFGLTGELSPLDSERDQNFHIGTSEGDQFVIKIANSAEDPAVIELQTDAMEHIATVDPELAIPKVLLSGNGRAIEQIQAEDGHPPITRCSVRWELLWHDSSWL